MFRLGRCASQHVRRSIRAMERIIRKKIFSFYFILKEVLGCISKFPFFFFF